MYKKTQGLGDDKIKKLKIIKVTSNENRSKSNSIFHKWWKILRIQEAYVENKTVISW